MNTNSWKIAWRAKDMGSYPDTTLHGFLYGQRRGIAGNVDE
ncbi:MAG: hypothetical protein ACYTGS_12950 [Planctomycetota bacterium]|jgi:hypothetical protein